MAALTATTGRFAGGPQTHEFAYRTAATADEIGVRPWSGPPATESASAGGLEVPGSQQSGPPCQQVFLTMSLPCHEPSNGMVLRGTCPLIGRGVEVD